jgi:hypothetical protein
MTEKLSGMVIGTDGDCPTCGCKTFIIKRDQKEVGENIILSYHTFCTVCQKKVREGETIVAVDKYGRLKVDI